MRGVAVAIALSAALHGCAGPGPDVTGRTATSVPDADGPGEGEASRGTAPAASNPATYVGRDACATCHADELARWRGSDHDLAMQEATEETVLGEFNGAAIPFDGAEVRFTRAADGFRMRAPGRDGALVEHVVAYTFGVDPLQQYLIRGASGRLQASGLAWDTRPSAQGGQRWIDLYPDRDLEPSDRLHWTGMDQTWNFQCAACHSTGVARGYEPETRGYTSTWSEIDVSCEACHGPGSAHVEWAGGRGGRRGGAADPDAESPDASTQERNGLIVDLREPDEVSWVIDAATGLARRDPPRNDNPQVETCGGCHARRASVREAFAFGRPLADSYMPALLDDVLYWADGQIRDEVFVYGSFLQSRMYAAGVTCSDCHEPHTAELLVDGNGLCNRCHAARVFDTPGHHFHEPASAGARCTACHMAEATFMVVDERADHSFRVPRPSLSASVGAPDACTSCHAEQSQAWAASVLGDRDQPTDTDFAAAFHAARRGVAGADRRLRELAGDADVAAIVRGTALQLLGSYPSSRNDAVFRRATADADPIVRLGASHGAEALSPPARVDALRPLLGDAVLSVRIAAAGALSATPPGSLRPSVADALAARLAPALAEYHAAQLVNAERPDAWLNIGLQASYRGALAEAEAAYRRAVGLDPTFVAALVNLADLFRSQGREADAEAALREALRATPGEPAALHGLGLLEVRRGRRQAALPLLRGAVEAAPEAARYAYVYAVAQYSEGHTDAAVATLRSALERLPGNRELLIGLAGLAADAGRLDLAREVAAEALRLAPDDEEISGLARLLGLPGS